MPVTCGGVFDSTKKAMENLPFIPAEIWREVFRLTTMNPGALKLSSGSQLQILRWRRGDHLNYISSLHTKQTLMGVCKTWYAAGAELLFEDCRPRTMASFERLVNMLKAKNASGHARGDGWWIRRLHVPTPSWDSIIEAVIEGEDQTPVVPHLLDAVRIMPNLQILTFAHRFVERISGDIRSFVPEIVDCLASQLLHLDHDCSSERRMSAWVFLPFELLPNLRHYSELVISSRNVDGTWMCPTLTHTRITSLSLRLRGSPSIATIERLSFPSLRHLTLPHLRDGHIDFLMPFLNRHGAKLVSISLQHSRYRGNHPRLLADGRFLACCPNLKEIIYLEGMFGNSGDGFYPTVTAIGIAGAGRDGRSLNSQYSLARFPNLQLVRVVDLVYSEPDPDDDPLFGGPEVVWSTFNDRETLRFEDAEGNPVPIWQGQPLFQTSRDLSEISVPPQKK